MKASILMPACNQGEELRLTIASAKDAIGDLPHEIIVCDDHSTDGSTRNLPKDVIVLHPPERLGCSGSRNLLQKVATGDILIWSDPHCRYPAGSLKKMALAAEQFKGIVQPMVKSAHADSRPTYGGSWGVNERGIMIPKATRGAHKNHPSLLGTVYVVRKDVFDSIHGWPLLPGWWGCSDTILGLLAWVAGIPIVVVDDILCIHKYAEDRRFKFNTIAWHHAANAHWMHKSMFPDTYESYWRPILMQHPKWCDRRIMKQVDLQLNSKRFAEFAAFVASKRLLDRTEDACFEKVLGIAAPASGEIPNGQTNVTCKSGEVRRAERESAFEWLTRRKENIDAKVTLDIGSGDGIGIELTQKHFPSAKTCGIDLVPERVAYMAKRGFAVQKADAEKLPFSDGTFDLVTCMHVLEHCPHPEVALSEIYRVLRPGGVALVIVPREKQPHHAAHQSCFARERDLVEMAREAGLSVMGIRTEIVHKRIREIRMIITKPISVGAVVDKSVVASEIGADGYAEYVNRQAGIAEGRDYNFVRSERTDALNWLSDQPDVKIQQVLDVGPRDGYIMSVLKMKGADVHGIEISPPAAAYAKSKGLDVIQGDVRNMPYKDASFDLVTCLHVLEHCPEPDKALAEMWRVVKPGGWMYVVVPRENGIDGLRRGAHYSYFPSEESLGARIKPLSPERAVSAIGVIKNGIREIRFAAKKAVA